MVIKFLLFISLLPFKSYAVDLSPPNVNGLTDSMEDSTAVLNQIHQEYEQKEFAPDQNDIDEKKEIQMRQKQEDDEFKGNSTGNDEGQGYL